MMDLIATALPAVFQLIAVGLKIFNAKQETLNDFEKLVEASASEGLISADTKKDFSKQLESLFNSPVDFNHLRHK